MSKKKGTVTGVGKGTYSYFIQIDTMDGFYFNTKYEPKCGKGDVVGIEYNKKDDKRGNVQKVTIIEKNSDGYKPTNTGGGGGAGGGYKAEPGRQESIVYQSSRKDALAYLALLLENKGFTLKGAAGKIEEQLEQKLTQIIGEFYQDAMTPSKSPALVGVAEDEKEDKDDDSEFEDDDEKEDDFDDEWDD